jgi:hypothetical protein
MPASHTNSAESFPTEFQPGSKIPSALQVVYSRMLSINSAHQPEGSHRVPATTAEFADNDTTFANKSPPQRSVLTPPQKWQARR